MILSEKLKEVRKRFGLSQEQLAEIMGVSRQAVAKWENGGGIPDISNLQLLAKTFGVTIDYLLDTKTTLPALTLRVEIDPQKYGHKKLSIRKRYKRIMQEYYQAAPTPTSLPIITTSSLGSNVISTPS